LSANDQVQIQQWVAAHGPRNYERHRHQEFVKFLRRLDQEVPHDHAITLGYGQLRHAHASQGASLARHPRFRPHFVPTSSSWLNLIERWFAELTSKRCAAGPSRVWMTCKTRSPSSWR
jgi:transposase